MKIQLYDHRFKPISLSNRQVEEYYKNLDNIGELTVNHDKKFASNECTAVLDMSKEAMLGFGTYLIRLACKYVEGLHYHIEPLGQIISNQAMGFFLTPQSPALIIGCNDFGNLDEFSHVRVPETKPFNTESDRFDSHVLVDVEFDNDYFEYHNLGYENIAELKVYRKNTSISDWYEVSLFLSNDAMLGLGTQLIRFAHRISSLDSISVPELDSEKYGDLGFYLTSESSRLLIRHKHFKNIFYYDRDFGLD